MYLGLDLGKKGTYYHCFTFPDAWASTTSSIILLGPCKSSTAQASGLQKCGNLFSTTYTFSGISRVLILKYLTKLYATTLAAFYPLKTSVWKRLCVCLLGRIWGWRHTYAHTQVKAWYNFIFSYNFKCKNDTRLVFTHMYLLFIICPFVLSVSLFIHICIILWTIWR